MGRKPVKDKKLPSAYPQIAFRVSEADKTRIMAQLSEVQDAQNSLRKPDAPFVNKNDVFVKALHIGLREMKWLTSRRKPRT